MGKMASKTPFWTPIPICDASFRKKLLYNILLKINMMVKKMQKNEKKSWWNVKKVVFLQPQMMRKELFERLKTPM
jgi:ERCC4-related helicase